MAQSLRRTLDDLRRHEGGDAHCDRGLVALALVDGEHRVDALRVDVVTEHREHLQHAACPRKKTLDPERNQVGQSPRRIAAPFADEADELVEIERQHRGLGGNRRPWPHRNAFTEPVRPRKLRCGALR